MAVDVMALPAHGCAFRRPNWFCKFVFPSPPTSWQCLCVLHGDAAFQLSTTGEGIGGSERPHGDSKVPPYSGLMRGALSGVHCDQCEARVQQYSAVCASTALVAAGRGLSAAATERAMLGPGVTPGNLEPPYVVQRARHGESPSSLVVGWAQRLSRRYATILSLIHI